MLVLTALVGVLCTVINSRQNILRYQLIHCGLAGNTADWITVELFLLYVTGSEKGGIITQNTNFYPQTVTTPRPSEPLASR